MTNDDEVLNEYETMIAKVKAEEKETHRTIRGSALRIAYKIPPRLPRKIIYKEPFKKANKPKKLFARVGMPVGMTNYLRQKEEEREAASSSSQSNIRFGISVPLGNSGFYWSYWF